MTEWIITGEEHFPKGDNPLGNRFYGYRRTELELPDGRHAQYHGVDIGDCVHVVALEDDETTYLVGQRRPNARRIGAQTIPYLLELPGGFAKEGVPVEESAQQELTEEIHRRANQLTHAGIILPLSGATNEHDHVFMGRDLELALPDEEQEATEQGLRVVSGKFGKLFEQMLRSELPVSGQTIAAMAKVAILL